MLCRLAALQWNGISRNFLVRFHVALSADGTDRRVLARKLFHDIVPMPRLRRLLSTMLRRLDAEFFHALSKLLFSASVAQEAVVPDTHETAGNNMEQKAPDEFHT